MFYPLTVLFLLVSLLILGFGIESFPLISPDEPRYAETAREMLERKDFIVPYCDYLTRFHKPVFYYWFEALSLASFGINEFAARLPSVLAGTGMVWLAFLLGSAHGFGFTAATIMLSSFIIFIVSKLSITDMTLCFFICAALTFFYLGYIKRSDIKRQFAFKETLSSYWFVSSAVMMAFGILTKGPVALVLPIIIIGAFLLLQRDVYSFFQDTWKHLLLGFLLILIIDLPWYIAVDFATHGAFTKEFFLEHNFSRYLKVHTNHHAPIWFYIPVIFVGLMPWSFFLVQAIISWDSSSKINVNSDKARNSQLISFALLWAIIVFSFFTVSKTKLPTYVLPVFLPLAVVIAKWWSDKFKVLRSNSYRNYDALIGLGAFLFTVIIGASLCLTVFKSKLQLISPSGFLVPILIVTLILVGAITIALTGILHQAKVSFIFITVATLIVYLFSTKVFLAQYAWYRDDGSKAFAQALKPADQLMVYRYHVSRFCFYGKRKVTKIGDKALNQYLTEINNTGTNYIITKKGYFEKYTPKREDYSVIKEGKVYTYASAVPVTSP